MDGKISHLFPVKTICQFVTIPIQFTTLENMCIQRWGPFLENDVINCGHLKLIDLLVTYPSQSASNCSVSRETFWGKTLGYRVEPVLERDIAIVMMIKCVYRSSD